MVREILGMEDYKCVTLLAEQKRYGKRRSFLQFLTRYRGSRSQVAGNIRAATTHLPAYRPFRWLS